VRRAALTQARDLVAPPVPLDPADADRLVAGALDRARHENELAAAHRRRKSLRYLPAGGDRRRRDRRGLRRHRGAGAGTTSSNSGGSKASSAGSASRFDRGARARVGDVSTSPRAGAPRCCSSCRSTVRTCPHLRAPQDSRRSRSNRTQRAHRVRCSRLSRRRSSCFSRAGRTGRERARCPQVPGDRAAASTGRPSRVDCVEELVLSGPGAARARVLGTGDTGGRPVYVAAFRSGSGYAVSCSGDRLRRSCAAPSSDVRADPTGTLPRRHAPGREHERLDHDAAERDRQRRGHRPRAHGRAGAVGRPHRHLRPARRADPRSPPPRCRPSPRSGC